MKRLRYILLKFKDDIRAGIIAILVLILVFLIFKKTETVEIVMAIIAGIVTFLVSVITSSKK